VSYALGGYAVDCEELLHAGEIVDSGVEGCKTVAELRLVVSGVRGYGGEGRV
jgi:hypothetical protein